MSVWTPGDRRLHPASGVVLGLSASGATLVVPEELTFAAGTIARAAGLVRQASERLVLATLDPRRAADPVGLAQIGWTGVRLAALAEQTDHLAVRTSRAAVGYAGADTSGVQLAGTIGGHVGDNPVALLCTAGLAVSGLVSLFGGELLASMIVGERDPFGRAIVRTTGELTQDGRTALLAGFSAGVLKGLLPGPVLPGVDLPATSATLRLLTGDPPPAVTIEVDAVRQLPPPQGLADAARAVGAAYCDHPDDCSVPRDGVVVIQKLEHGDGSPPSWLVAIPGTQSPAFGGSTVTDMTTNLALDGGLPDQMTAGVIDAMRRAGIEPGDPVLLAGHSQGGMTAQAVAVAASATGAFSVRAVVGIGSPSIPATPPGVPITWITQHEDAITGVDGAPGARMGPQDLAVYGDLSSGLGDVPGPDLAHDRDGYVELAARADADLAARGLRPPGMDDVFGNISRTETYSYQVTRDPAVVASAQW